MLCGHGMHDSLGRQLCGRLKSMGEGAVQTCACGAWVNLMVAEAARLEPGASVMTVVERAEARPG